VPTCVKKFAVISAKMPHFKASVSTIFNTFFKCSIFSSFSPLSSSQKCFLFCFVKIKQKTLADETNKEIFQGFPNTKKRVKSTPKKLCMIDPRPPLRKYAPKLYFIQPWPVCWTSKEDFKVCDKKLWILSHVKVQLRANFCPTNPPWLDH